MTPHQLDMIFPFVVFFYGALMTFVLNQPRLMVLAEQKMPRPILDQMKGHRALALICLAVGFPWSLQNLWGF